MKIGNIVIQRVEKKRQILVAAVVLLPDEIHRTYNDESISLYDKTCC